MNEADGFLQATCTLLPADILYKCATQQCLIVVIPMGQKMYYYITKGYLIALLIFP
jgi:hypothetical protein